MSNSENKVNKESLMERQKKKLQQNKIKNLERLCVFSKNLTVVSGDREISLKDDFNQLLEVTKNEREVMVENKSIKKTTNTVRGIFKIIFTNENAVRHVQDIQLDFKDSNDRTSIENFDEKMINLKKKSKFYEEKESIFPSRDYHSEPVYFLTLLENIDYFVGKINKNQTDLKSNLVIENLILAAVSVPNTVCRMLSLYSWVQFRICQYIQRKI